jgi:N-formylglutamate deformylase
VAVHAGHQLRREVHAHVVLPEAERLREEDVATGEWVRIAPTGIVVHRSRFEVDLNRPMEKSVYRSPDESWGLEVWRDGAPPEEIVREAHALHRAFYDTLEAILRDVEAEHGRFVVYDLHAYNHRRGGPHAPPNDPRRSPDINIGTGSMDRPLWAPVVDAFLDTLSSATVLGRRLDVRENVCFEGGYLPEWVHRTFPRTGCALAVEVKKFFMDEWTGEVEPSRLQGIEQALARTVPAVREALEGL